MKNEDLSDEHYAIPLKEKDVVVPNSPRVFPFKITPSHGVDEVLGKQAIPYYYFLSKSLYSLQHYWDFEMTSCNKEDHHFSYHASYDDDSYTNLDSIIHPFAFSVNECPFYRMEGHIGRLVQDANFLFPLGIDIPASPLENDRFIVEIKSDYPLATAHFQTGFSNSNTGTNLFIRCIGLNKSTVEFKRNNLNLNFDLDVIDISNNSYNEFVNFYTNDQFRGMEHIGGVMRGGTWVLLTMDVELKIEVTVRDTEQGNERRFSSELVLSKIIVGDFYYPGKCKPIVSEGALSNATNLTKSNQPSDTTKDLATTTPEPKKAKPVATTNKRTKSGSQTKTKSTRKKTTTKKKNP